MLHWNVQKTHYTNKPTSIVGVNTDGVCMNGGVTYSKRSVCTSPCPDRGYISFGVRLRRADEDKHGEGQASRGVGRDAGGEPTGN